MTKEALLIIDVQNDFCPGGSLAVNDGDKVVESLNHVIESAKYLGWEIIATRDWHPTKTIHFKIYGGIWPEHCVQGTKGAQFHPDLNLDSAIIFSKGMGWSEDSYSGFDGQDDQGVKLEDFLEKKGIESIYIGGLATDYCIKATAIDGANKGFDTYLLTDAIAAVNLKPRDGKKAIEEMKRHGVSMIDTQYIVRWAGWS